MKAQRHVLALACLLAVASAPSFAQTELPAEWSLTGNAGLFSDYRFRGISQTNKKPAFQGGFDLAHKSGFYVGNWNSNVDSSFYNGSNLEMDFYGGFKGSFDAFGYDVGAIYYYYPGSDAKIDNTEIYVGGSWGPVSLKWYYAVSDFFSVPDTDGSWYLTGGITYPVPAVEGLSLVATVGYQKIEGGVDPDSITDWKIGATYDWKGWVVGASYIDTNRDLENPARPGRNISDGTFVVSLSKSF